MSSLLRTINHVISAAIGVGIAVAQAISTAVGWHAMPSTFERLANAAAAPLAGAAAAGLWLLIARTPAAIRHLITPSSAQVQLTIAAARADGLLPDGYTSDPQRDLLIFRTITFDRKAGLTEEEIREDLANLLPSE